IWWSGEEAEGVSGRIEAHPDVLLRLDGRELRAARERPADGALEIVDEDIEVLGDVLPARLAGPDGRRPVLLVFKVQGDLAGVAGGPDLRPARIFRLLGHGRLAGSDQAVKQPGVEPGELARVRATKGQGGELESWRHRGLLPLRLASSASSIDAGPDTLRPRSA